MTDDALDGHMALHPLDLKFTSDCLGRRGLLLRVHELPRTLCLRRPGPTVVVMDHPEPRVVAVARVKRAVEFTLNDVDEPVGHRSEGPPTMAGLRAGWMGLPDPDQALSIESGSGRPPA